MKKRYTVHLGGAIPAGERTGSVTINYDLRTLIPIALREKKFILRSAFISEEEEPAMGGCEIGISFEDPMNTTSGLPARARFVLGVAQQEFYENLQYNLWDSYERMINYPEYSSVTISFFAIKAKDLLGADFRLLLQFEECEDY